MTKGSKILLVRSVAALESIWRPTRNCDRASAVHAARQSASSFGGGTVVQRKASERMRAELAAAGLMIGGEVLPTGRRLARRWVYPYRQAELIEALDRIKQRSAAGDCRCDYGVPESLIAASANTDSLAHLQAVLIPALADGVLESSCTTAGNCFYNFSPLVSPDDIPAIVAARSVDADDDLDGNLCDVYTAEFHATWRRVMGDRQRHQDIGPIPVPILPLESGRDYYDYTGIAPLFAEAATDG